MARRVVLHIGAMKSGTSFLQNVLGANREALLAQGVLFAGTRWRDQVDAVRDVAEHGPGALAPDGPWCRLAASVRDWAQTAVISMEFLAPRSAEQIALICGSFGDAQIDVVMTARDIGRTIPAMWLESTQNGATATWEDFLDGVRSGEGPDGRDFHRHQDLPALAARWSEQVGREHLTIITVPPPGAPARLLWDRFATVLGVDLPEVDLDVRANPGLGLASALVLRRFNERYRAQRGGGLGPEYLRLVKHRLAKGALVHREEPRLGFDERWARRLGLQQRDELRAGGYRVLGDLDELTPQKVPGVRPKQVGADAQLDAAVDGLIHLTAELKRRRPGKADA